MAGQNRNQNSLVVRARDGPLTPAQDSFEWYPDYRRDQRPFPSRQPSAPHFVRPMIQVDIGSLLGFYPPSPPHHYMEDIVPWLDSGEPQFTLHFDCDQISSRTPRVRIEQIREPDASTRRNRRPRLSGRIRALFENHDDSEAKENEVRRRYNSQTNSTRADFDSIESQILDHDDDWITIRLPRRALTRSDGFNPPSASLKERHRDWVIDEAEMFDADPLLGYSALRHYMVPSERLTQQY